MSDELAYALRKAIRAERIRRDLTQAQMASRMSWSRNTYAALESGARHLNADEIPDLCRALGVPFSRLLVDAPDEDRAVFGA